MQLIEKSDPQGFVSELEQVFEMANTVVLMANSFGVRAYYPICAHLLHRYGVAEDRITAEQSRSAALVVELVV